MESKRKRIPFTDFVIGAFSVLNIAVISLAINFLNTFITPQIFARLSDAELDLPTFAQLMLAFSTLWGKYGLIIYLPITALLLMILALKKPRGITTLLSISSTFLNIVFIIYSVVLLIANVIGI